VKNDMKKTMTITAFNRPGYLEQMLRDAGSMAVLFHAAMVRWTESIADLRAVADPGRMGLGDLEGGDLRRGSKLFALQPLYARATHIGRDQVTYCVPEFYGIIFDGIRLCERTMPVQYRISRKWSNLFWNGLPLVYDLSR